MPERQAYNPPEMPDPVSTALQKKALEPVVGLLKRIAGPLADEVGESLAITARKTGKTGDRKLGTGELEKLGTGGTFPSFKFLF